MSRAFHLLRGWAIPSPRKHKIDNDMKIKSILILAAGMLVTAGFAAARPAQTGRCGQPRGTCGNECDGSGFMNQGRGNGNGNGNGQGRGQGFRRGPRDGSGNGNGNGQGLRRGPRDGSGQGAGAGDRQRRRDGSGQGTNRGN
jgi:hypothetical protein